MPPAPPVSRLSIPHGYPRAMSPSPCPCGPVRPVARPAAEVNAAIRALSAGRDRAVDWDGAALTELARLRAEWQAAVVAEGRDAA